MYDVCFFLKFSTAQMIMLLIIICQKVLPTLIPILCWWYCCFHKQSNSHIFRDHSTIQFSLPAYLIRHHKMCNGGNDLDSLNITRPTITSWNWSRCACEVWQHAGFSQLWKPVVVQGCRMLGFYVFLEDPDANVIITLLHCCSGVFVSHDLCYNCWSAQATGNRRIRSTQ